MGKKSFIIVGGMCNGLQGLWSLKAMIGTARMLGSHYYKRFTIVSYDSAGDICVVLVTTPRSLRVLATNIGKVINRRVAKPRQEDLS